MKKQFTLFQSHLDLAKTYWEKIVKPGDVVVDATCGNGYDTCILAHLALSEEKGILYAFDPLEEAIKQTKKKIQNSFPENIFSKVVFLQQCHSIFPEKWEKSSIQLFVYNLGYLPGGDKSLTTKKETTLKSIEKASFYVAPGGAISITCYPGHPEGLEEEKLLLNWSKTLSPKEWSVCFHQWLNRHNSPSLLFLQKSM